MYIVRHLFRVLVVAGLAAGVSSAGAEERECPNHPDATYTLRGDPDADKSMLEGLAKPAKDKGAVCIVAYYDGQGPANSKMLAFRRANWTMEQLTEAGVPAGTISRALRASDKSNSHMVQVILGP